MREIIPIMQEGTNRRSKTLLGGQRFGGKGKEQADSEATKEMQTLYTLRDFSKETLLKGKRKEEPRKGEVGVATPLRWRLSGLDQAMTPVLASGDVAAAKK